MQAHHWEAVLDAVSQMEKRRAIDPLYATQLRQQAWLEKIRALAQDAPALLSAWKSVPAEVRQQSKIAAAAARALIRLNDYKNALQILADSLNTQWDSDLARLYGDCIAGDPVAQIEQAENWLKQHSDDAGLLLALGKLCLHQRLWGKAQNYLEASISVSPSRDAHTALGQLAEMLQKPEEAFDYFQKAMKLAGTRSGD